jgi:hypothetical protein
MTKHRGAWRRDEQRKQSSIPEKQRIPHMVKVTWSIGKFQRRKEQNLNQSGLAHYKGNGAEVAHMVALEPLMCDKNQMAHQSPCERNHGQWKKVKAPIAKALDVSRTKKGARNQADNEGRIKCLSLDRKKEQLAAKEETKKPEARL